VDENKEDSPVMFRELVVLPSSCELMALYRKALVNISLEETRNITEDLHHDIQLTDQYSGTEPLEY
jgi:hypothetical protein